MDGSGTGCSCMHTCIAVKDGERKRRKALSRRGNRPAGKKVETKVPSSTRTSSKGKGEIQSLRGHDLSNATTA